MNRLLLLQILQNFRLDYQCEDVSPVLNLLLTPDRPLNIKFVPRNA
jgi:hypothetical protein